ncbi:MAG: transposase [bacterium]|nr:transposase [bacterium]
MGERSVYFSPGEWFHCFNRGVDKRRIFLDKSDYRRFLALLYACNSKDPIHVSNYEQGFRSKSLATVLNIPRKETLVDIGAYDLLPNHHHFLIRERRDGGITSFMRKLGTAYTMYFNIKYRRSGALYQGAFKAKHVGTNRYFDRVLNYIHGNHAVLFEPRWKEGVTRKEKKLPKLLVDYPYSSLRDYFGELRAESVIVDKSAVLEIIDAMPAVEKIIEDARTFSRLHDEFSPDTKMAR